MSFGREPPLPPKLSDANAVLDAAVAAREAGREEDGILFLKAALKLHPRNYRLWHMLGLLHRRLEQSEAACQSFAEAARLAPNDPKVRHAYAQATLEGGGPALKLFDWARQAAPGDGELLIGRSAAQAAEGRLADAIADLELVTSANPDWVAGIQTLARLRWLQGDRLQFAAGFERALAERPRNVALWLALIDMLIHAELYAEARAAIARAREKVGEQPALALAAAICASELRDDIEAERIFRSIGDVPETVLAVRHMRHLLRVGRVDEAAIRGEAFVSAPDANQIWPYIGIAWRLLGDPRWDWLERDESLVGIYELGAELELPRLATLLRDIHASSSNPLGQSVRGGSQTDGPLFARIEPEIRSLREALSDRVKRHIAGFSSNDPAHPVLRYKTDDVRFAGSWSVRLTGGGSHTNHIHPLGWLSSAFYVALPDEADAGGGSAGWLALGQPPAELGIDLPPVRLIEPRPGRLVIFPSIMWHGTVPFGQGERLSVAADIALPWHG